MPYDNALLTDPLTFISMTSVIAFIGGGNMAASLLGGLRAAQHPASHLRVAELDGARRDWLQQTFGVPAFSQAADAVADANAVVLAVKPQQMHQALQGLTLREGCTVISIAAGLSVSTLRRWLGDHVHIIRTMPNTPALLGAGISGLFAPAGTPQAARDVAHHVLSAAGQCVWVKTEAQIDAVTAVSGSGPAYFFLLTEAMREAGTALGLDAETAARLAKYTLIGAARMADGDVDVAELRARVTSKGGTTFAALQTFEDGGFHTLTGAALAAAAARAAELGQLLDKDS